MASKKYSASGVTTTAATRTMLQIVSAATIRPCIAEIQVSSAGTPADNAAQYQLKRFTVAPTVTSFTPTALDPADPASLCATGTGGVGFNASAEGTYTANSQLDDFATNQRATVRIVANPGYEFRAPATAANGLGLQCIAIGGSGIATLVTFLWEE